ncbi:outer membrane protein assembly factor BamB family protein [Haladaptatus sp. NG-WS-4]
MRARTTAVVGILLLSLVGAGAYALLQPTQGGQLTEMWVSDTARDTIGNHHVPAVGHVDGTTRIIVPVNAERNNGACSVVAVDENATRQWEDSMPEQACNIHGYGDPIVADYDGDGTEEVIVGSTEEVVLGYDPTTGKEEFRYDLSWWGYTPPIVTDFAPTPGTELVVTDMKGTVFVFSQNGSVVWKKSLNGSVVVAPPAVDDFDADGTSELVVGGSNVSLLERNGTTRWKATLDKSVTWMTTGQADDDEAIEVVAGMLDGRVIAFDGRTGEREWTKAVGKAAAVDAFGNADGDGQAEVYVTAKDGKLRALDASDGTTEWTTTLTTDDVQMTPPPVVDDIDSDGDDELVAVTQTGTVSVVNPKSGAVLATYERDVPIWTYPALDDIDGDGEKEILAVYGDGRVVALEFGGE